MHARVGWSVALFVTLASGGLVHPENGVAIDLDWLARVKTEGRAAYEKYKAASKRLEAEYEVRSDKAPGPAGTIPFRPQTWRDRVIRLGDNAIIERVRILDDAPTKPQIHLQCDNSDYHFSLVKAREAAPYALGEYTPGKRRSPNTEGFHDEVFWTLHRVLAALDGDNTHTLRALRFDDTKGLLRIDYSFGKVTDIWQNQLYVDPSHYWRVVELRSETSRGSSTQQWTYGVTVGGLEFPTEKTFLTTSKVAEGPPNIATTIRLISLKETDKTPADFRLSAFGLPEPRGVAPLKSSRWYLWFIAAGVVSLAVGAFLWRRLQQRKGSSAFAR
jgi:hypothetical protein